MRELYEGQGIVNFQTLTLMSDHDLIGMDLGHVCNTVPYGTNLNCQII
jgi:hypothetical protein